MQKAKREGDVAVAVSRFGHETIPVCLPKGATVNDVLDEAGIELAGNEKAYVEGEQAEGEDVVENGDVLSIVTPKQAG